LEKKRKEKKRKEKKSKEKKRKEKKRKEKKRNTWNSCTSNPVNRRVNFVDGWLTVDI
jgi:F0F1-type ATP synthase assembly protein I